MKSGLDEVWSERGLVRKDHSEGKERGRRGKPQRRDDNTVPYVQYQIECGTAASHKGGDLNGTGGLMVC